MNKRKKVILLSALISLLLFLGKGLDVGDTTLVAVFAAAIAYFGLYWILEFEVIGLRLIFVFVVPVLFNFLFVYRVLASLTDVGGEIGNSGILIFSLLLGGLNYIVFLTANILNVASFKKIPLLQVAQTTLYFFTVLITFLLFDFVQSLGYSLWVDVIILFIAMFLLLYQQFWFVIGERRSLINVVTVLSLILIMAFVMFSFWPINIFLLNLSLAMVVYVLIGLVMHISKNSLTKSLTFEYIGLLIIVAAIITLMSDWGSFGNLF